MLTMSTTTLADIPTDILRTHLISKLSPKCAMSLLFAIRRCENPDMFGHISDCIREYLVATCEKCAHFIRVTCDSRCRSIPM
jgi:hypothetical protein